MSKRVLSVFFVLMLLVGGAAACGDDSGDDGGSNDTTSDSGGSGDSGSGSGNADVQAYCDDVAAFDDRLHHQALCSAAIHGRDDHVLRHIDQATGQITGVGGLQSSVRQTFSSTVGRDEVLQNIQTFAEVRRDRCFDNRAIRLGHQATHTSQLSYLCCRTTGA